MTSLFHLKVRWLQSLPQQLNTHRLFRLLELLPLPIFLVLMRVVEPQTMQDWRAPYFIASIPAVFALGFWWWGSSQIHGVLFAINLYILSGSLGLLTELLWLNQLYGDLQASGMLAWVFAVGLILTLCNNSPVIQQIIPRNPFKGQRMATFLAITCGAFLLSFAFRGHLWLAEIIPFTAVFVAYRLRVAG